jgi:hypothetical protein
MEKAIKLNVFNFNKLDESKIVKDYDFIYLGSEFCENLLDLDCIKPIKKLNIWGKRICFLTPIVTDKGIKLIDFLLKEISKIKFKNRLEISVNDFGVLNLIYRKYKGRFTINIGRHLSRNFFTIKKDMIEISTVEGINFLNSLNIKRFEISNFSKMPSIDYKRKKNKFKLTMFYPYTHVSTTRMCMLGMPDIRHEDSIDGINCNKECLICDYKVKNQKIKEELIVKGNSVFVRYENNFIMDRVKLNVDRIVFSINS